jgi:hypothetical protein
MFYHRRIGPFLGLASLFFLPIAPAHSKPKKTAHSTQHKSPKNDPALVIDPELRAAMQKAPSARQWPDEDYVCLLDLGDVQVMPDGTVVSTYRTVYKLFNERARKIAEVAIPYNAGYQVVDVAQARTITRSGKIVQLDPDDEYTVTPYSDYALYSDAEGIGFSMPGIEDDCIIDYTIRRITLPAIKGHFWEHWGISTPYPVMKSRYTLTVPNSKKFQYKLYNNDTLKPIITPSKDGKSKSYTWKMMDVKPIEIEPMMPGLNEVSMRLEATSLSSWQDVSRWYRHLAEPQIASNPQIAATVKRLIAGKTTERDKANAIYNWVADRIRYVGLEFGEAAYKPHAAGQVHTKLYGDCKDKAILLIAMLKLAGIEADPALLRAEETASLKDRLPTPAAFNHCIALAKVDGKPIWLDATSETCAYGDIPSEDRGASALVVKKDAREFQTIPTYAAEKDHANSHVVIHLREDGSAEIEAAMTFERELGQFLRGVVLNLTPDKQKEFANAIGQQVSAAAKVREYSLSDPKAKGEPYVMKFTLDAPNYAQKAGSVLLLPLGARTMQQASSNPFTKDKRVWPIVMDDNIVAASEIVVHPPKGYAPVEVPKDLQFKGLLADYERHIEVSAADGSLTVQSRFTDREGRAPASQYDEIRSFYDAMLKSNSEQLILKKAD